MRTRGRRVWWSSIVIVAAVIGVIAWRFDLVGLRSATPLSTVAIAFDPPPPQPYMWLRDGRAVSGFELSTFAGPDHCGWQSATFLIIGWPVGTVSRTIDEARQYVRDPHGAVKGSLRDRLVVRATLPADARPTGYRHGSIELYLSPPDQDDGIYVVGPGGAERWPRDNPPTGCE
jgi:hypothetical protein